MPRGRHASFSKPGRWRLKKSRRFTRRRFLLGSMGLVLLLSVATAGHWLPLLKGTPNRKKAGQPGRLLNGTWEFQPVSLPLGHRPPLGTWHPIAVPSEWNMTAAPNFATPFGAYDIWDTPRTWDQVEAGWYRTRFSLKEVPSGRLMLLFEAVNFQADVYVNGHWAGSHAGGTVPFSVDITDQASVGDNTVWVAVTGPRAMKGPDGFNYPMGSWWGQLCGGIWQNVWLVVEDLIALGDMTVTTSVRTETLSINLKVTNRGATAETVHLSYQIWDQSQEVLRHDRIVQAPPNQTAVLDWTRPWTSAHWWNPDDPHLYEATVTARVNGKVRDATTVRFGFREVWVTGQHLILNHRKIRLFGDEWHYFGSLENNRDYAMTWFRMAHAAHANYVRLHAMPYPPVFYDVADEVGMLIVAESAIYGSSKNLNLNDPQFWVHAKEHLVARVRRDRHHPSVILWSAENEVLLAYGPKWSPLVASLKEPITRTDNTRPVYFEGDGDPDHIADLISWHYPLEITQAPALPASFYAFAPGESQANRWKRTKPLMISEFGLMWEAGPSILSVVAGQAPFLGMSGLWMANALITQAQIEGFRAAGVTGVTPWNLVWYGNKPLPDHSVALHYPNQITPGPRPRRVGKFAATLNPHWLPGSPGWHPNALHGAIAQGYQRQTVIDRSWSSRAFGGTLYERSLTIHNDVDRTTTFTISWRWSGGGRSKSGTRHVTLAGLGQTTFAASIDAPSVRRPTVGAFETRLAQADGTLIETRHRPLTFYPRLKPERSRVAVLDPLGKTRQALTQKGYDVQAWDGQSIRDPIIIAEGMAPGFQLWSALESAVGRGGRVLALAQPGGWAPANGLIVGHTPVTTTFIEAPHNRAVKGVNDSDLSWWRGSGDVVAEGLLDVPPTPAFKILANGGETLSGASLVTWTLGRGQAWFCQYPLIARLFLEPMAERLLDSLIQAAQTTEAPLALQYWGSRLSPYIGKASTTQVPISSDQVLLVDMKDPQVREQLKSEWQAVSLWVHRGGRLWLHDGAEDSGLVRQLTGWPLKSVILPAGHERGGLNTRLSFLTDGVSPTLLDWTYPKGEPPLAREAWTGVPKTHRLILSSPVDWQEYDKPEQIKTASVLVSVDDEPKALVFERSLGLGVIIVDELQWDQNALKAHALRARLESAITGH